MVKKKVALITGVTGQDGAYLAEFLLEKGYKVYGTFRRVSLPNFGRLEKLGIISDIELVPFDLLDQSSIIDALKQTKPDEIYNLAAQSFVGASFEQPVATGEITGLGLTRLLDSVRAECPKAKFYQASSSEMFGNSKEVPQNENTPFKPVSPYATAKLYAHWVTMNYKKAYNLFACAGILFNHESPLRGLEFVTRKITYNVAQIKLGFKDNLELGNMDSKRDWGYAKDYVEAMWSMLQQKKPKNYVIATGETHSVREFAEIAFNVVGLDYKKYVRINPKYIRPTDINVLMGDPSQAINNLRWDPKKTSFKSLIDIMIKSDLKYLEKIKDINSLYDEKKVKEFPHFKE